MSPKTSKTSDPGVTLSLFRQSLTVWGRQNFRPFPWRLTDDPYCVLIAEAMLHRTQVKQVVPIYERFIVEYPDIESLARADRDAVHTIMFPLGLRWRTDLLLSMSALIVNRFGAHIPQRKSDLVELPGVSDYIASSVRCFAWNFPEALIDTNTVRVAGRLLGLQVRDSSRRNARFRAAISAFVDPNDPCTYNYALLDLAALVCKKATAPLCDICPVRRFCSYANGCDSVSLAEVDRPSGGDELPVSRIMKEMG